MTHAKVQIVLIAESDPSPNIGRSDIKLQNYLLLLLQTNKKRGSFWQNITGSVENEDREKSKGVAELTWLIAAQRELFEETKIKLELPQFVDLKINAEFTDVRGRNIEEKCFLALYHNNKPAIVIDPHEHQAYRWVKIGEVQKNFYKHSLNYDCFLKSLELLGIKPSNHQILDIKEE